MVILFFDHKITALSRTCQCAIADTFTLVSVPSNIAEGSGRASAKEKIHFIEIAYGSLMETYCQLTVAVKLGYLSEENAMALRPQFTEVAKMLSGWRNNLKSKL